MSADTRFSVIDVRSMLSSLPVEVTMTKTNDTKNGWQFDVAFLNQRGLSVINHDRSGGLEAAVLDTEGNIDRGTPLADDGIVGGLDLLSLRRLALQVAAAAPESNWQLNVADLSTHGESEQEPMSPWEREFLNGFTYEKFADDPRGEHVAKALSDAIVASKDPLTSVELTALALKAVDEYDTKIRWRHVYVVVYRDDSDHGRIAGGFEVFTTREHAEKVATAKCHVLRASAEEERAKNGSTEKIDRYEWDCYDVIEAVEYL